MKIESSDLGKVNSQLSAAEHSTGGKTHMLAAAARCPETLELFKLVLSLQSSHYEDIPVSLEERFNLMLTQAKQLAKSPGKTVDGMLPESIDLALEILSMNNLAENIAKASSLGSMSPNLARRILQEMDSRPI